MYEFEGNYDPKYLNLDPNDENSWKIFAEKVRHLMSKCMQVPKVPLGYRNFLKFQKAFIKYEKLLSNIRSGKVARLARFKKKKLD
jgi:hypothetical protein